MPLLDASSSSEMSPSRPSLASPPPKPSSSAASAAGAAGERLLSLLIRLVVMSLALPVFFLFASVSAVILLHLCLAGLALRRPNPNPNPNLSSLLPADLRRMEWFRWPWPPDGSCAVCLDRIRQGDTCRKLRGCQHVFHRKCVDQWLLLSANCPLCREAVRPDGSWI